ncbi:hypothetical protein JVT61DRAFT_756 [Boletus reticuloceps]|uniref:Uncharacterized protein n=1 Tax=Boletus reticuloceps TaxID=495285 RepID=A0A8I3AFY5_9AGAM|nr:hypothetical protein JVT61DRAFT_756 [Boletus reticuloceps]
MRRIFIRFCPLVLYQIHHGERHSFGHDRVRTRIPSDRLTLGPDDPEELATRRRASSLATFLIITLLLPILLVAPVERDIRIINVVNPFYAAASLAYSITEVVSPTAPLFKQEGRRSLETIIFMRHLQRVLDALPSGGQVPKTDKTTVHVVSDKVQKSNIVAVSVCPGISRGDTIATLLKANGTQAQRSILGTVIYFIAQPLLRLLTKSQTATVQSILHVLFLPTPFKSVHTSTATTSTENDPEEVLKAGALYRECAVAPVRIPTAGGTPLGEEQKGAMADDRELGGVHLGQSVWESFEVALKEWEKTVPALLMIPHQWIPILAPSTTTLQWGVLICYDPGHSLLAMPW